MKISEDKLQLATLFTGIGAIEHALIRMGIEYDLLLASDKDRYVKKSYFANYPIYSKNWYIDVNDIDGEIFRGEIDLLVGGSPCQPFSPAGHRKCFSSDEGKLFFRFFDLVEDIRPITFIYENVPSITKCDNGEPLRKVKSNLIAKGYKLNSSILNGIDYGIPQSRKRYFLIGSKIGNPTIQLGRKLKLSMQDLLQNDDREKWSNYARRFGLLGDFYMQCFGSAQSKYYLSKKMINYITANGTKKYFTSGVFNKKIAYTILATVHKMHRMGIDNYIKDDHGIRRLTPRECLRLMGFDDRFRIVVSDTQMYKQAGNSIIVDILISLIQGLKIGKIRDSKNVNKPQFNYLRTLSVDDFF